MGVLAGDRTKEGFILHRGTSIRIALQEQDWNASQALELHGRFESADSLEVGFRLDIDADLSTSTWLKPLSALLAGESASFAGKAARPFWGTTGAKAMFEAG
ncbi:MAG: hypothetical protein RIS79_3633 [Verrucomicrobiota bacterium]|jgi:hypothetical protein